MSTSHIYSNSWIGVGDAKAIPSPRPPSRKVANSENQPIQITLCHSWKQIEERISAWEGILRENPSLSIFSTPEWLGSWWKAFGPDKQMMAMAFSTESGALAGLAPFYLDYFQSPLFGRLASLRLIGDGSGDSDNLDLIIRRGFEAACARSLLRWLADRQDWDVCSLNTLPENSQAGRNLIHELKAAKWPFESETCPNSTIHLPATWQLYLESVSPDFRPLLTRYPRRLAQRYKVRIRRCEKPDDLPGGLEILFSLHKKRWNEANQPGSFDSQERREFYLQMAESFLQKGWLELWFLELNGAAAAAQFCFRFGDTVHILQEGFDPRFAADKVGYALRAAMLQHFIEEGIKRYDFLGGLAAHKQKWGAKAGAYVNLRFARPGSPGSCYLSCATVAGQTKEWLRNNLPPSAWKMLHWLKLRVTNRRPDSPAN